MKFTKVIILATFLASSQAVRFMPAQTLTQDHTTGDIIPICNGANEGACTEADDVVIHHVRRDPSKRAAKGDEDWDA